MKLLFAGITAFLQIKYAPELNLYLLLALMVVVDYGTGVYKAKIQGKARTSHGFRKTVSKFMQYAGAIICSVVLSKVAEQSNSELAGAILPFMTPGLTSFIIYIEVTSVFENLYAIDSKSKIAVWFYKPALSLLTFQLKNNPVIKQAEALEQKPQ